MTFKLQVFKDANMHARLYMPTVVLYYCSFQSNTLRLKIFSLVLYLFIMYILFVWKLL